MSVIRLEPFRGFDFINEQINELAKNVKQGFSVEYGNFVAKMDILEDNKIIEIVVEIPGVAKEDVKVVINNDNKLEIKGTKKTSFKEEDVKNKILRIERNDGEFSRTVLLPDNIDKNSVTAKFNNGELRLTIAKIEQKKPNQVEITIE